MYRTRALVAVAVAVAVLAAPAPAYAAGGPEVVSAHSDYEGERGTLLVTASAPAGVASIHAAVRTYDGTPVTGTDDFVLRSGTAESGVWANRTPFLIDRPTTYWVDVTLTDTAGATATRTTELHYSVVTWFEELRLGPAPTYERRTVTVSGVLRGRWPGTGEVRPIPGVMVTVYGYPDYAETPTGADGRFSAELPISEAETYVSVNAPWSNDGTAEISSAHAGLGFASAEPRPTRVTADITTTEVPGGRHVTVTGAAQWQTPSGWVPAESGRINIVDCWANVPDCGYGTYYTGVDLDASGTFTLDFTFPGNRALRVSYGPLSLPDGRPDVFLARSHRDFDVTEF